PRHDEGGARVAGGGGAARPLSVVPRRLVVVSERPRNDDPDPTDGPEPDDAFDELVEAETNRDPDLAVIEAGSRTLRAQAGPPQADVVPGRPEDPEVDAALRAVETELMGRWPETKLDPSLERIAALMDVLGEPQRSYPS